MEFSVVHEIVHRLKIAEAMKTDYVAVSPAMSMRQAQQKMREARVNGMPVVAGDTMVGIITTEDIIKCLDFGDMREPIANWMTREVVTVGSPEPLTQAMSTLDRTGFGRLPVLDSDGHLCGVITPESILRSLLVELSRMLADEAERDTGRATMDGSVLRLEFDVAPRDFDRAGMASVRLKRELARRGCVQALQRRVAIACHECETNLTIHTVEGGRIVALVSDDMVRLTVSDKGPGIEDIEQAMTPGYSTASDFVRDLGFGAGMGLPNIRRCADRFEIRSKTGSGTWLNLEFDLPRAAGESAVGEPTDGADQEAKTA